MPSPVIRSDFKRGIPAAQQGKIAKSCRYLAAAFAQWRSKVCSNRPALSIRLLVGIARRETRAWRVRMRGEYDQTFRRAAQILGQLDGHIALHACIRRE